MVVRGYLSAECRNIEGLYLRLLFDSLPKFNCKIPWRLCGYISALRRNLAVLVPQNNTAIFRQLPKDTISLFVGYLSEPA